MGNTCCFFGHREVNVNDELIKRLRDVVEWLITVEKVDTFLFGSKSEFDDLCLDVVTKLKEKYIHIRRIYVRAEFQYIDEDYRFYILNRYEDTYYPECIINADKAVYVERNYEMIDKSNYCVVYYDESYMPPKRKNSKREVGEYQPKSGTKLAVDYAAKKGNTIINIFECGNDVFGRVKL